ncbi:hypothetical protein QQS21_012449 [Conoideocrella luteorostrata]|uniref:DUF7924 domain-containing protein n=1 Tax=Conoideocrella luteorostrata TaxID=1105319 RepID=A0AAJ0FSF9_9HYPO|nr:hypothetical protein QQS21_012449 [Conoideocrella luteorostrata]
MASSQDRKRPNADEPSDDTPPTKRVKASGPPRSTPPGITPAGWDNLSKIWLTPRALKELDRRNNARASEKSVVVSKAYTARASGKSAAVSKAHTARASRKSAVVGKAHTARASGKSAVVGKAHTARASGKSAVVGKARTARASGKSAVVGKAHTARSSETSAVVDIAHTSLARFARRGGPDLGLLRRYPEPKHAAASMSVRGSSGSSRSQRTRSTQATTVSSRNKRSSAYDNAFEQTLIDHNIYPEGYKYPHQQSTPPEPSNLEGIMQGLSAPRASLSPSRFSQSAFKEFKQANSRVISEGRVMRDIFPTIRGNNASIPNEGNLPFANFESITEGTTVNAVPDFYDGTNPTQISSIVRQDLNKSIIPSSHGHAPLAPNFFLEAKAPRGGADVARRQACLDGAYGARAMHSLQNYGNGEEEEELVYDGNAHTFSTTYHAGTGTLQMYAHHMTAPTVQGERPEYHMTQLRSFSMTDTRDTFIAGATAFRNARDLAQQHRNSFIEAANARASQAKTAAAAAVAAADETAQATQPACDADSVSHVHVHYSALQDADDALQQHVAETSHLDAYDDDGTAIGSLQQHVAETGHLNAYDDDDCIVVGSMPQYLNGEDGSAGNSQQSTAHGADEASQSVASSFTSVSTKRARSKRPRQSASPPSSASKKGHSLH